MRVSGCSFGLALLLAAGAARAEEGLDLVWDAPAGCPTRDEVLELALRQGLPRTWGAGVARPRVRGVLRATPQPDGEAWTLTLSVERPAGVDPQTLVARSCATLRGAAAHVLINVLPDTSPAPAPPPPALPPARAPRVRFVSRASLGVTSGLTATVAPRVGGALGLAWGRWLFEGGGTFVLGTETTDADGNAFGVGGGYGALRACRVFRFGESVQLRPCAEVDAGALSVAPRGNSALRAQDAAWAGGALSLQATLRLARVLRLHGEALVGFAAVPAVFRYTVEGAGGERSAEAFRQSVVRGELSVGVEIGP